MYKIYVLAIAAFMVIPGCNTKSETGLDNNSVEQISKDGMHAAKVTEKIDASNYTYLRVNEKNKTYWIAVTSMDIQKGDMVYFSQAMEMKNFKSESLNRTFESILFVQDASKFPNQKPGSNPHSNLTNQSNEQINIETPEDGKTVEQIYAEKMELKGRTVKVRGKVIKINQNIMNRNWVHLQDGTGDERSFDLVITTQDLANAGDIITVEGTVAVDKDFGSGYFFPVIVEEAKIVK